MHYDCIASQSWCVHSPWCCVSCWWCCPRWIHLEVLNHVPNCRWNWMKHRLWANRKEVTYWAEVSKRSRSFVDMKEVVLSAWYFAIQSLSMLCSDRGRGLCWQPCRAVLLRHLFPKRSWREYFWLSPNAIGKNDSIGNHSTNWVVEMCCWDSQCRVLEIRNMCVKYLSWSQYFVAGS